VGGRKCEKDGGWEKKDVRGWEGGGNWGKRRGGGRREK